MKPSIEKAIKKYLDTFDQYDEEEFNRSIDSEVEWGERVEVVRAKLLIAFLEHYGKNGRMVLAVERAMLANPKRETRCAPFAGSTRQTQKTE